MLLRRKEIEAKLPKDHIKEELAQAVQKEMETEKDLELEIRAKYKEENEKLRREIKIQKERIVFC